MTSLREHHRAGTKKKQKKLHCNLPRSQNVRQRSVDCSVELTAEAWKKKKKKAAAEVCVLLSGQLCLLWLCNCTCEINLCITRCIKMLKHVINRRSHYCSSWNPPNVLLFYCMSSIYVLHSKDVESPKPREPPPFHSCSCFSLPPSQKITVSNRKMLTSL